MQRVDMRFIMHGLEHPKRLMMSEVKSVNGYLINKLQDGQWWVSDALGEAIAGPFASESAAIEVAAVLQDQPKAPRRRSNPKP